MVRTRGPDAIHGRPHLELAPVNPNLLAGPGGGAKAVVVAGPGKAARAGEHGLGFAVVADEVRKLAEKSAQSTKEISELIGSIQKEARKAVENMEKSTTIVNEGLNLGQDLNAALRKISNVVTEVYKFAQEIGAATNGRCG